VVVVALVFGARYFKSGPVEVTLALDFGARAAKVREATLVFTSPAETVARSVALHFPSGSAAGARHRLRLRPSSYTVGVRLALEGEPEPRTLSRRLAIGESGTYPLDLSGD